MKTLPASPARLIASALALGVVSTFPAAAQPSSGLPSSYTYMGAPPPGYPASTPPAASTQRRPATTPQRSAAPVPRPSPPKTTMPHGYGPIPDSLSMQVAQLAANDQQQEGRIRKLEKDVSGIKSSGGVRFTSAGTDTAAASLRPHTSYVVRPGDSLWRIASAHRVAPGEVMSLNRMKSDTVVIGQTLMIPAPHGSSTSSGTTQATFKPYYHDVRPGDTSSTISKKYNVSRNALMAANPRVDFGGGLIPGSRVVIPGKSTQVTTSKPSSAPASPGGSYIVKPGDSLKAIAIKHGTSTANLAALNGIKDVNKVVVGQRIVLPGGKAPTTSRSTASTKPKTTPPPASTDTVPLPGMGMPPAPPPAPPAAASPPPAPKPASASESSRGVLAYRVDATDTIESIANQFSTTPARIREMNHLQATTRLNSGDEIMVPAMGAVAVGN